MASSLDPTCLLKLPGILETVILISAFHFLSTIVPETNKSKELHQESSEDDAWNHKIGSDDKVVNQFALIAKTISYFIIIAVALSFLAFLICLFCPISFVRKKPARNSKSRPQH